MKIVNQHKYWLLALLTLLSVGAWAQQKNVLSVPDAKVSIGQAQLPVAIENTNEIIAAQFDLTLPSTISAGTVATVTNRCDGHEVIIRKMEATRYRVMLRSDENRALIAQQGTVFYIPLTIPQTVAEGSELPLVISNATLIVAGGANVLTDTKAGKLIVSKLPDLTVTSVAAESKNITPGERLSLSWQVKNVGGTETGDGWSEQILLVNKRGTVTKLIGTVYQQETLAAGAVMSRQADITVPQLLGIEGEAYIQVKVIANSETGESALATGNNIAQCDETFTVAKRLFVEPNPATVTENYGRSIAVKVSRSGDWSGEQTFTLSASEDSRVTLPAKVTIPVGQSGAIVYMTVTDNTDLDDNENVTITAKGNNYPDGTGILTIEDNEYPNLTLTASKSVINEGETFQLTVTTSRVSAQPIEVTLTSEDAKRFSFPQTVTIAAGETSATVEVTAIDDELPSLDLSNAFTASAQKYNKAEVIVLLKDNDLPVLELQLTPTTVSESAGVVAVAGVLRRTTNTNTKITVKLTDDADGGLYFGNRTLVLDNGIEEVHFNFGPVDNAFVDGNRTYTITAAVWLSSCSCGASGESAGYVEAQLQVLDNDGAALTLTSSASTVREGGTAILTVSRNTTDTSSPLTVMLSSDDSNGVSFPNSVIIPAGQQSTTVEVTTTANDIQGDSHTVVFTIQADGYATGTCYITITDQTMPDAIVTSFVATPSEVEVGEGIMLTIVVANQGISVLPAHTAVSIKCNGQQQTLYTPADLNPGENVDLQTTFLLSTTTTGQYQMTATVNPDKDVRELNYNNNTSASVTITLLPNFTATVSTDKTVYRQGETITINGQTSAGGKNANVEIYLVNDGTRQSITVQADAEGRFQTAYQPYSRQAGHFTVGACYPGTGDTFGSAECDVYGLRLDSYYSTHDMSLGDEVTGNIVISNPTTLSQSALNIEMQGVPNGCEFTLGQTSSIGANASVTIPYTLKATTISDGTDWLQLPLHITTAEGSTADFTIYYFVRSIKGKLKASQTRIETTMTKGKAREYQLQVTNIGRGETGIVTLSLPSWIEPLTPREMPSLSQGDTATVVLRMMPTDDMQLNVPVSGQLGINCDNGDGVGITLQVTPVSEETGTLIIDVVDEYTYYTESKPHVEGAQVVVKSPANGSIVAQGITNSNGTFSAELPEGWYNVSISAEKHQGYSTTIEVAPGTTTGKQIFLTYEAITYSWEVEETEVEDYYEIETVVKYETNVPKPVIILNLPDEMPQPGSVIAVLATNKGLISANDLNVTLSISEGYELEWLTEPTLDILAPQQTAVFYAKVKEASTNEARGLPRKAPGETYRTCMSLYLDILGHYLCGEYEEAIAAESSRAWGDCLKSSFYTNGGTTGGSSGGWSGGGGYVSSGNRPQSSPGGSSNSTYVAGFYLGTVSPSAQMCHKKEEEPLRRLAAPNDVIHGGCGDTEINGFQLIPDKGPEYNVFGVAADGVSKVRIIFKGKNIIPIDEQCGRPKWHIQEGIGTLENVDSWDNVVYKAPEDFPGGNTDLRYIVHAVLEYDGANGATLTHTVPIVITRTPLALIHGLNSGPNAWLDFALYEWGRMYDFYQLICVDYSDSHLRHFAYNEHENPVVQNAIKQLRDQCMTNGIVATKVDLVGHSMGGILARCYVQYVPGGEKNVHKLITVNTPHSGSPVANFVKGLSYADIKAFIYGYVLGDIWAYGGKVRWTELLDWDVNQLTGAITDLAIGSVATDDYLNDSYNENSEILAKMNNIPVHAIASQVTGEAMANFQAVVGGVISGVIAAQDVSDIILATLTGEGAVNPPQIIEATKRFASGIKALFKLWKDSQSGLDITEKLLESDCIVPFDSQTGGLPDKYVKKFEGGFEYSHMSMTENEDVWDYLKYLLNASVKDEEVFCMTGFHPKKLEYSVDKSRIAEQIEASSRRANVNSTADISLAIENDSLHVTVMSPADPVSLVIFDNGVETMVERDFTLPIPTSQLNDIMVIVFYNSISGDPVYDIAHINAPLPKSTPVEVKCNKQCQIVIGQPLAISLNCTWADGSVTHVIPETVTFTDNLASYSDGYITGLQGGSGTATFTYQGLTCEAPFTVYNFGMGSDDEGSNSVCSTVSLKLSQQMVMTRQAFRGTLTVFNGNSSGAMKDVRLTLTVTDPDGKTATPHEFQINAENLDGFTGEADLGSGWTLAANSTGTATVLFIPTKYAAPTEPVEWSFGGTLSYIDPYTGLEVTRELYPVTLTVKPSPELDLTYFMQRDVYGDDPLTLDVTEPMKPAEFALLINNKGFGDATNVRMVTQQPEIIDNEKGLYIDFELLSSQVNGGEAALSFGKSIANYLGDIPAHSQMYAQWWLTSTLLGHFVDYKVEATHVTSYGNKDLSLLDQVTIHELIHGFDMPKGSLTGGPEIGRAFLVNDIADALDNPDKLYFTNGDTASVVISATATTKRLSDTQCELTVTPSAKGWNYGSIYDPTHGYAELKSIVRKSDGKELGSTRFWQTDRTLHDGKDWLYEYRLHFVDDFATGGEQTYLLTFDPVPEKVLEVVSIGTVPAEGEIAKEPIETLTVDFNKEIDATTFTGDDITFAVQGVKKNANQIGISTEDNKRFTLDMSAMNDTLPNGYYTMTVQTADITDAEGYKGKVGKQTSWILFRGGLIVLNTAVWPARSGNINFSFDQPAGTRRAGANDEVEDGTAKYGAIITFTATPDEGHQFLNWTLNGEVVSSDPTYTVTALSDMNVVANFSSLPILIEVEESEGGHIEGLGTGIYEHHADLTLTAVPDEDYVLKAWLVNGEEIDETSETLTLHADEPMKIKAVFEHEFYRQTMTLARGWNWVSSYISEAWPVDYMNTYANRIVGQFDELINDPQYGLVGGLEQMTSGVAYKVEALERFSTNFRGHLLTSPITLKKGWNWVAYPWTDSRLVSTTITDAEEGDYLVSQRGFTEYADGYWEGSLRMLMPGEGYLYKSASNKTLGYDFTAAPAGARSSTSPTPQLPNSSTSQLLNSFPSTMSITARLYQDGMELFGDNYLLYAMNDNELRGVGEFIGSNYYVTVYGDQPVDINFVVENTATGETFLANEHLTFREDVVGSRKQPFAISIGEATGICDLQNYDSQSDSSAIYDLQGRKIENSKFVNSKWNKGIYIVNGHKVVNGKYVNK